MAEPAPEALVKQARACASLARALSRALRDPESTHEARKSAAYARLAGAEALAGLKEAGASARDWRLLSRDLVALAEYAAKAFEESELFGAEARGLRLMADRLTQAVGALEQALRGRGETRTERLLHAKAKALEVEDLYRRMRAEILDDPATVRGLKLGAVARRLSDAAESAQNACDRLAERLGAESR